MRSRLAVLAALAPLAAACGTTTVSPVPGNTLVSSAPSGGNAAAGKAVFLTNACGSCHTLAAAGTKGKVGPDLDQLAAYAQKAGATSVAEYATQAITNPPAPYVPPGFPKNAMPSTYGTTLSSQKLADLVAFVTQSH